jgi:hypothetical protein
LKYENEAFAITDTQSQTKVPLMRYIYENISTDNSIEFTLEGVKTNIPSTIALDIFFDRVLKSHYTLPPALMGELKQDDFHLFLDALNNSSALARLEQCIYVYKENETHRDTEGYIYKIIKRSKNEVILEYTDADETVRFVVSSDDFILNQDSLRGALKSMKRFK